MLIALLWTIVIGFLVGGLAKLIMPGKDPGGFWLTSLLGIGGAVVAKLIGQAFGWYGPYQPAGFLAAVVGAIIILAIYRMSRKPAGS